MISVWTVLYIMGCHWFADFYMQTDQMARGKSTSNFWLSYHVVVYTGLMFLLALTILNPISAIYWALLNGILHFVTDYFTSRASSVHFKAGDYHNGFVVVGIDQWIHLACLLTTTLLFQG